MHAKYNDLPSQNSQPSYQKKRPASLRLLHLSEDIKLCTCPFQNKLSLNLPEKKKKNLWERVCFRNKAKNNLTLREPSQWILHDLFFIAMWHIRVFPHVSKKKYPMDLVTVLKGTQSYCLGIRRDCSSSQCSFHLPRTAECELPGRTNAVHSEWPWAPCLLAHYKPGVRANCSHISRGRGLEKRERNETRMLGPGSED